MSETLGGTIDRLITCCMKLWAIQDRVHKAASAGEGLDAETVKKLSDLNLQRNRLMAEVDQIFAQGVEDGVVVVDSRIKIV